MRCALWTIVEGRSGGARDDVGGHLVGKTQGDCVL